MEFGIPDPSGPLSLEKFIELDNIVQYLFNHGLLSDIECRKIVFTNEVVKARAAIYSILVTKKSTEFKNILQILRSNVHPLQNPKVLERIFSFLKFNDIENCQRVCRDWKEVGRSLVLSKYDEINLQQLLLDKFIAEMEILNTELESRKPKIPVGVIQLMSLLPEENDDKYLLELLQERKEYFQTNVPTPIIEIQASVFQLMLSLNPENDDTLLELLHSKTDFQTNVDCAVDAPSPSEILMAEALSNDRILRKTLKFLPLKDMKKCRIVCRTWNSVAESFLRKGSIIHFKPPFGPLNFINISKYSSLPDLHFTAFKFGEHFEMKELTEFFSKFGGNNITRLDLCLRIGMRECLSYTSNLSEVHLEAPMSDRNRSTDLMIPLNKLISIKILRLSNIFIDVGNECRRIVPVKIHINNVHFYVGGSYPGEIILNNYVDFSQAKDVKLTAIIHQTQTFDWAMDTFKADRMTFQNIRLVNVQKSKSSVDHLSLYCREPFAEKTYMSIKQFIFENGSLKLSALPSSVEKLAISKSKDSIIDVSQPFHLPNLKQLSFRKGSRFDLITCFDMCHNLTDLEISGVTALDKRLPRSVKRLKLKTQFSGLISVEAAEEPFDLDLLIVDYVPMFSLNDVKFDRIRPKVLVLQLRAYYEDDAFMSFLQINPHIEKIYVEFKMPMHKSDFNGSHLCRLVDKESNYYEFSNGRGRGITSEEFFTIQTSVDIMTALKNFRNSDEQKWEQDFEHGYDNSNYTDSSSQDEDSSDGENIEYDGDEY